MGLQDILEFIDDSPHGVILFTFGSTVAMTSIPEGIQKLFKEALEQLPQRVLLKYEGEMVDKPKNVMTRKWFPQRDILSMVFNSMRVISKNIVLLIFEFGFRTSQSEIIY